MNDIINVCIWIASNGRGQVLHIIIIIAYLWFYYVRGSHLDAVFHSQFNFAISGALLYSMSALLQAQIIFLLHMYQLITLFVRTLTYLGDKIISQIRHYSIHGKFFSIKLLIVFHINMGYIIFLSPRVSFMAILVSVLELLLFLSSIRGLRDE